MRDTHAPSIVLIARRFRYTNQEFGYKYTTNINFEITFIFIANWRTFRPFKCDQNV